MTVVEAVARDAGVKLRHASGERCHGVDDRRPRGVTHREPRRSRLWVVERLQRHRSAFLAGRAERLEKRLRGDDADAAVFLEGEQVLVPADQVVGGAFDGTLEIAVIVRVVTDDVQRDLAGR